MWSLHVLSLRHEGRWKPGNILWQRRLTEIEDDEGSFSVSVDSGPRSRRAINDRPDGVTFKGQLITCVSGGGQRGVPGGGGSPETCRFQI